MVRKRKDDVESPITSGVVKSRKLKPAADKFRDERDNFRKQYNTLAGNPKYVGKFVAIIDNQVVASSKDRLELELEMSRNYPEGGFYIGKIYPTHRQKF